MAKRRTHKSTVHTSPIKPMTGAGKPQAFRISAGKSELTVERVENTNRERGISVVWHSETGPKELLDACVQPERAAAETDLVVMDPLSSEVVERVDLDDASRARKAMEEAIASNHILQFNAPFWSLTLHPKPESTPREIEFRSSAYSPAVVGIIGESGSDDFKTHLKKVEVQIRAAIGKLLGTVAPKPARKVLPRRRTQASV